MNQMYRLLHIMLWMALIAIISPDAIAQGGKSQGIGTNAPDPKSLLELNVPNPTTFPQGLLLPRLTTGQRTSFGAGLTAAQKGMAVFDTGDNKMYVWDGAGNWQSSTVVATSITGIGSVTVSGIYPAFTISGPNMVSSQWTATGNDIYYDLGKVGIGTSSPFGMLGVVNTTSGSNAGFFQTSNATNAAAALYAITQGTSRAGQFLISNAANTSDVLYANTNGQGSVADFNITNAGNTSTVLKISTNGTGKAADFQGAGGVNISSNLTIGGLGGAPVGSIITIGGGGALGYGTLSSSQWTTTSTGIYYGPGNVGIGNITNPQFKLDVSGGVNVTHAKFGQIAPIYIYSASPGIGFNTYWNAANYIYGAGSANQYVGILGYNEGFNEFNFSLSQSPGNAGNIVGTLVNTVKITTQGIGIGNGTLPNEKLTVQGNSSTSGIGYFGTIMGNNLSGAPTGSVVTTDGTGRLGYGPTGTSSQWTTTTNGIYYGSGNVNIGTAANPTQAKLIVTEDASVNPAMFISGGGPGRTVTIQLARNNAADGGLGIAGAVASFSGIAQPGDMVLRAETNNMVISAKSAGGDIKFATGAIDTEKMRITNNGRVGIGTSAPNEQLTIQNNASVSGKVFTNALAINNLSISGSVLTVDGVGNVGMGTLTSASQWVSASSNQIFTNSFVGIGNTTPIYPLHIWASEETDYGIVVRKTVVSTTTGNQIGISTQFIGGSASASKIGLQAFVTAVSTESIRGVSADIRGTGAAGTNYRGLDAYIQNDGVGPSQGVYAQMDGNGNGNSAGILIINSQLGSGERYGVNAVVNGGAGSTGAKYAIYGSAIGGAGSNYSGYFEEGLFYIKSFTGINVLNPTTYLDVQGNIRLRSYNTAGSILTVDGLGNVGMGSISSASQWINASSGKIYTNSIVGIGINNPTNTLSIATTNNDGISINATGTTAANGSLFFNSTTTSPVQINSALISIKNTTGDRALQFFNSTQSIPSTEVIYKFLDNTTNPIISILNNGSVGIGTMTPAANLDITGSERITQNLTIGGLSGAAGSIVTVDGAGKLGTGSLSLINQWLTTIGGIYTTSSVGIGELGNALPAKFSVSGSGNDANAILLFNNASSQAGSFTVAAKNGAITTTGAGASVQNNGKLGSIGFGGYDGATYMPNGPTVEIAGLATQNFVAGANGSKLVFRTTSNGSNSPSDRITLDQNGRLLINTVSGSSMLTINAGTTPGLYMVGTPATETGVAMFETYSTQTAAVFAQANASNSLGLYTVGNGNAALGLQAEGKNGGDAASFSVNSGIGSAVKVRMENASSSATGVSISMQSTIPGTLALDVFGTAGVRFQKFGLSGGGAIYSDNSGVLYVNTTVGAGMAVWTLSGGNVTLANTMNKVGIGTSFPAAKLDISNDDPFNPAIRIQSNTAPGIWMNYSGSSTGANFSSTHPSATTLSVSANTNQFSGALHVANNGTGPSIFATNQGGGNAGKFETQGNQAALSAQANANSSTSAAAVFYNFNTSTPGSVVTVNNNSTVSGATGMFISMQSNTMIGLSMSGRLSINGINSQNNSGATFPVAVDASGTFYVNTLIGGGGPWTVYGSTIANNPPSSSVLIGNTVLGTTQAKLQVSGDVGLGDGNPITNNAISIWLQNNTGGAQPAGAIVVVGPVDDSFNTTNVSQNNAVAGILIEPCPVGNRCRVAVGGVAIVQTSGAVNRGQHCVTSTTFGQAASTATPNVGATIGVYLQNTAGPGTARVLLR